MSAIETVDRDGLVAEEQRLAEAAAGGDGDAFATLYERYEPRAFNLAFRIVGSRDDAADAVQEAFLGVLRRLPARGGVDLAFGSYVFTATRNACYDLMEKRRRAEPSDAIPESATPLGGGAGGLGLDPGDPDDDPTRRQLLDSQRGEIREANERLPDRQREALALRELEELSYDEIAEIMEMNRNSVAQLISRARLNLRTELRGATLESVAVSSPDCERALPLIAMRDDGQLQEGEEADWLGAHLAGCGGCRVRLEAMQEAGASYRAWAPIAAAPWLFEETMAKAAELVGADWSETIAERAANRRDLATLPGMPAAYMRGPGRAESSSHRRWAIAAALIALLCAGLVTAREVDNRDGSDAPPVVESRPADAPAPVPAADKPAKEKDEPVATEEGTAASSVPPPPEEAPATGSVGSEPVSGKQQRGSAARPVDRPEPTRPPGKKGGSTATVPPAEPPAEEPETTSPPQAEPEPPPREPEPPPREPRPPTAPGGGFKAPPPSTPPPQ